MEKVGFRGHSCTYVTSPVTLWLLPDNFPIYLRAKRYFLASESDLSRIRQASTIVHFRHPERIVRNRPLRLVDSNVADVILRTCRRDTHTSFQFREGRVTSGSRTGARNSAELVTLYEMKWTLNEKLHSSARKARPSRLVRTGATGVHSRGRFKYNSNVAAPAWHRDIAHVRASASPPSTRLITTRL